MNKKQYRKLQKQVERLTAQKMLHEALNENIQLKEQIKLRDETILLYLKKYGCSVSHFDTTHDFD